MNDFRHHRHHRHCRQRQYNLELRRPIMWSSMKSIFFSLDCEAQETNQITMTVVSQLRLLGD